MAQLASLGDAERNRRRSVRWNASVDAMRTGDGSFAYVRNGIEAIKAPLGPQGSRGAIPDLAPRAEPR